MSLFVNMHNEAMSAANSAAKKYFDNHGEPMYCGFAWVEIRNCNKQPQKDFVKALSKEYKNQYQALAEKTGHRPGYTISPTYDLKGVGWIYKQSMDIKEEACRAYAKYLCDNYDIDAYMMSRAD